MKSAAPRLTMARSPQTSRAGLPICWARLTERERFVLDKYYREGISMKALADQYQVNQNRIRQIIRHAVKKMPGTGAAFLCCGWS